MKVDQVDIAHLTDASVKRLAVMYDGLHAEGGELSHFCRVVSVALVHAMRERRRMLLLAQVELMNDDDSGSLVGPDHDPIGEAREALRRAVRRDGGANE